MNEDLKAEIQDVVLESLIQAEQTWSMVGAEVTKALSETTMSARSMSSVLPGHPTVDSNEPAVDTFIALTVDMRDSTNHLIQAIKGSISQLQRVYYETSALLPAAQHVIAHYEGRVTEYMGDGLLAFFRC